MFDRAVRFISFAAAVTVVAVSAGMLFKTTRTAAPAAAVTQLEAVVITAKRG